MLKLIKIIKPLSELCHCFLPQLSNNYIEVFNLYRVNCFLESLEMTFDNTENIFIIFVKDYPLYLESLFLKNIHFSYLYRKNESLPLPNLAGSIHRKDNLLLYIDFLLTEYSNNIVLKHSSVSNPLYNYEHFFNCAKALSKNKMMKLIVIPYLSD